MLGDVLTVMWKERLGLLRQPGSKARAILTLITPLIFVGVYMPAAASNFVRLPLLPALTTLFTAIVVAITVPDSFAGERERHTLATLLASRLSDRAILFGKLAVAVGAGWAIVVVALMLGLITTNLVHHDQGLLMYSPEIALASLLIPLLIGTAIAAVGILISLRAESVQGAQQTLMAVLFTPLVVLQFLGLAAMRAGPALRGIISAGVTTVSSGAFVYAMVVVLLAIDFVLVALTTVRFQRAHLIAG